MVHEVVNRGDVFALRVKDQALTIVPGTAEVEHVELYPYIMHKDGFFEAGATDMDVQIPVIETDATDVKPGLYYVKTVPTLPE
jgi:hypothetical protein